MDRQTLDRRDSCVSTCILVRTNTNEPKAQKMNGVLPMFKHIAADILSLFSSTCLLFLGSFMKRINRLDQGNN